LRQAHFSEGGRGEFGSKRERRGGDRRFSKGKRVSPKSQKEGPNPNFRGKTTGKKEKGEYVAYAGEGDSAGNISTLG